MDEFIEAAFGPSMAFSPKVATGGRGFQETDEPIPPQDDCLVQLVQYCKDLATIYFLR